MDMPDVVEVNADVRTPDGLLVTVNVEGPRVFAAETLRRLADEIAPQPMIHLLPPADTSWVHTTSIKDFGRDRRRRWWRRK